MKKEKAKKIFSKKVKFQGKEFEFFLRRGADESVVAEIFEWREYRVVEKVIRDAALPILDIGAHIGIFALYAKAINPAVPVYTLEPEKENFDLLLKNISASGMENVKTFKIALAGATGKRSLVVASDSINHRLADVGDEEIRAKEFEKISAISFGDFLHEHNISEVGLLKMDVEGGEYEIFENFTEKDFNAVNNIIFEYHNYNGRNYREIENILRENGFGVQRLPSGFEKDLGFIFAHNKRKKHKTQ